LVSFLLLTSVSITGQCPSIALNSSSSSVCGLSPVNISGTFDGSATLVTISSDGKGSVSPAFTSSSPFSFTYVPKNGDLGEKISIRISTNNLSRKHCSIARQTYTLTVNEIPSAPERGTITQPNCTAPTGSVILNGLPAKGTWTITRSPEGGIITGTGTSATASNLSAGKYNFAVRNSGGCISALSGDVSIVSAPEVPSINIKNPSPVCFPSTIDLTDASIIAGSDAGLTYTYWRNNAATQEYNSPSSATQGTYYIKGTLTSSGCSDVKPVTVTVRQKPLANAGPDVALDYLFETELAALDPGTNVTGKWSVLSGSGSFSDPANARARVSNLELGTNVFLWTLTNEVCPPSYDSVMVKVLDIVLPSLITPNMDGRNDYFVIGRTEILGKIELVIFDRRGVMVYKSMDYNNLWNGIDYNGDPLSEDTYFYSLKSENGRSINGFVLIRR
jgi:gliding motility-associated-like protein